MKINQLQNLLFIIVGAITILIPIFLIARYRIQNKKNNERHNMELRNIAKQWENKK